MGSLRWVTIAAALSTLAGLLALRAVAAGPVANPCSLLTSAEVTNTLRWKVDYRQAATTPKSRATPEIRMCSWYGKRLGFVLTVAVAQTTEADFKHAERVAHASRPVTGIGAMAFTIGAGGGLLDTWTNGFAVSVGVTPASTPARLTRLMRIALTRL